jgi:tRNA(fMet)-specific endonuclease VapC
MDTNACINAMRGLPAVVSALARYMPAELAVSSITAYELYTGVEKCAAPDRERAKVQSLLQTLHLLEFDFSAATESAAIRADLENRGQMIGPYDILLAGQARSLGLVLVTANIAEFSRIRGLSVENWQATASDS